MASIPIERVLKVLKAAQRSPTNQAGNGPYAAMVSPTETILRHYGTMVYHSVGSGGRKHSIKSLGGFSASDQAAISTAMWFDGIGGRVTRSAAVGKKNNGIAINGWFHYR